MDERIAAAAKSIYNYSRARTGNREEAEDLSQDILVALLQSQCSLRDGRAFYGFMWAVAGNVYKNWCKKRARVAEPLPADLPDKNPPVGESLEHAEDVALLRRELALLTSQHRRAMVAYYFHGQRVAEIARAMGISESMTKFLLFKSRKQIKEGMSMERTRGEKSFNPGTLKLAVAGGHWHPYLDPTVFERNTLAQNILLACYHERLTAEEISLQLGVAVPYLESDLEQMETHGLLKKQGNKYAVNIVIFTKEFAAEEHQKTAHLQREVAEILENCEIPQGLTRWNVAHLVLEHAVLRHPDAPQLKKEGLLTWGDEDNRYSCINPNCAGTGEGELRFLEFFAKSFNERLFDFGHFWKRPARVDLLLDIARGRQSGFTEDEITEIAELIKFGWLHKDGEGLSLPIPVYAPEEYARLLALLQPAISRVAALTREMLAVSAAILAQHSPSALKNEAQEIAFLRRHNIALSGSVDILLGRGILRPPAENEHPTVYVLT